jgi:hypothetical protein
MVFRPTDAIHHGESGKDILHEVRDFERLVVVPHGHKVHRQPRLSRQVHLAMPQNHVAGTNQLIDD